MRSSWNSRGSNYTQFLVNLIIGKLLKYVMKDKTIIANTAWAECSRNQNTLYGSPHSIGRHSSFGKILLVIFNQCSTSCDHKSGWGQLEMGF